MAQVEDLNTASGDKENDFNEEETPSIDNVIPASQGEQDISDESSCTKGNSAGPPTANDMVDLYFIEPDIAKQVLSYLNALDKIKLTLLDRRHCDMFLPKSKKEGWGWAAALVPKASPIEVVLDVEDLICSFCGENMSSARVGLKFNSLIGFLDHSCICNRQRRMRFLDGEILLPEKHSQLPQKLNVKDKIKVTRRVRGNLETYAEFECIPSKICSKPGAPIGLLLLAMK